MRINIPPQVETVIQKLNNAGYEAYIVGGCVRDSILGLAPSDWDVTTSALPDETELALSGFKCIKTGIKHGTISVLINHMPVEVTTYRIDGQYSDNRHPDSVRFTRSLKEDLSRRDFTVNALAYNHFDGIIDCFDGMEDLKNRRIRCVGIPDLRFQEDGLRILRALRFSSVLEFTIERNTSLSILNNRDLLDHIARERINSEFTKLLCGNAENILRDYRPVFEQFVSGISLMAGFQQNNPYHIYDVWEHTLKAVAAAEAIPILRLTMFLYDIGKPLCYTQDENGIGHFYGHGKKSAEMAKGILEELRYDGDAVCMVSKLINLHDLPVHTDETSLLRLLNKNGEKTLRYLFKVKTADIKAQNPVYIGRLDELKKAQAMLESILARGLCFSLKDLQLNGSDLLSLNIPQGAAIGRMLSLLLDAVLDGKCPNSHDQLIKYALHVKGQIQ
nr:CCA tRNA nucleotidyltransferase [uncultured Caproiciproducens sp.]